MKYSYLTILFAFLCSCSGNNKQSLKDSDLKQSFYKVLFVVSNATHYGTSNIETTNNFPEIVYAYHEFVSANIEVDFVSPKGGQVPIGYIRSSDSLLQNYLLDTKLSRKLKNTLTPAKVIKNEYQAIYYVGGGAAMFGVPENKSIQEIAQHIVEKNEGILSAICHGTAGIVNVKNSEGTSMLKGKQITGFPDAFENTKANYYKEFPFAIDNAINNTGASFTYSEEGWDGNFVVDGNVITGQDPTAAALVAKKVIEKIKKI